MILFQIVLFINIYQAPEILNGEKYDNRADIWSVGTVFYELLFGKPPYTASNIIDLIKNVKSK